MCSFNVQLLLLYTFFLTAVLQNHWTLDLHTNTVFFCFFFFFMWLPTRTQNRDKPIVKV